MASLDLTAAFDLVNIKLFAKRLRIMGQPMDLVNWIKIWLTDRKCDVEVGGSCSILLDLETVTAQGSVPEPFLYAIFALPLFYLTQIPNFADNNFVIRWNEQLSVLIENLEFDLEFILKCFKELSLKANEGKTEMC
jgi:hypothetical protein